MCEGGLTVRGQAVTFTCFGVAQQHISAGIAAVLFSLTPIMSVFTERLPFVTVVIYMHVCTQAAF
jgi:drug/metabolite transporter (DMT)-like permease